jgi:hypothetical protein
MYTPRVMYHDHHCLLIPKDQSVTLPKSAAELRARAPANLIRALKWTTSVIPGLSDGEAAVSVGIGCYCNNRESLDKR